MYLVIFCLIGGGTLFGGLLVTYEDIPDYFKPVYFVSVTAVTQRALVVNDFLCCYMTYKCTDTAAEAVYKANPALEGREISLNGTAYTVEDLDQLGEQCPARLDSDPGNLGRYALEVLGLNNVDNYVSKDVAPRLPCHLSRHHLAHQCLPHHHLSHHDLSHLRSSSSRSSACASPRARWQC